jgi:two-component system, response regulator
MNDRTLTDSDFLLLLGEDDEADVILMKRILKSMDYQGQFHHISLGQELVDWVCKKGSYRDSTHPLPQLIVLDIGLPEIDGKSILKLLRQDEQARQIPIIMMSGSVSERDFHDCIALGCNGYIQKSEDLKKFIETCHYFIKGWINLSRQLFI